MSIHLVEAQTQIHSHKEKPTSTSIIMYTSKDAFQHSHSPPDALNIRGVKYLIFKVLHLPQIEPIPMITALLSYAGVSPHIQRSDFAKLLVTGFLHTVYGEIVSDFRCHSEFKKRIL